MRRGNPTLIRGLHYFEAVARNVSIRKAAAELKVSDSAVSHQLRELTDALGEHLIVRSGRGIALTPMGEKLAGRLSTAFKGIEDSVSEALGVSHSTLRLGVCSSFGPGWMIPRLGDFNESYPGIDLQLRLYSLDSQLTDLEADAFVGAFPVKPGYQAIHIFDEMLVAVQAPGRPSGSGELNQRRLITTDVEEPDIGLDWVSYCEAADLELQAIKAGSWLQCTHFIFAIEMAKQGLGVALVPDFLAAGSIAAGTLVPFARTRVASKRAYKLFIKTSRIREPELYCLSQWFKAQAMSAKAIPIGQMKRS